MTDAYKQERENRRKEFEKIISKVSLKAFDSKGKKIKKNELKRKCHAGILIVYLIIIYKHDTYSSYSYGDRINNCIKEYHSRIKENDELKIQFDKTFRIFDHNENIISNGDFLGVGNLSSSRCGSNISLYTHDIVKKIYSGNSEYKESIYSVDDLDELWRKGLFKFMFQDITRYLEDRFILTPFYNKKGKEVLLFEFSCIMKNNNKKHNHKKCKSLQHIWDSTSNSVSINHENTREYSDTIEINKDFNHSVHILQNYKEI